MPAPNFILSPCTPADVPGMVEVYLSAFEKDNFSLYCLPRAAIPAEEWDRWLTARFTKLFNSPEIRCFKITDSNNNNRQAAFARWAFPYTPSEEKRRVKAEEEKETERLKEQGIDTRWPNGANLEVCDLKFGPLDSCREKTINEEETFVCHLLCVHQDYWRQGLGGMLLRDVLALADDQGAQAWIEATPAGRPLYAKLGFKEVNLVKVDLSRWGGKEPGFNWGMLREASQQI
ncbi:hypothetical protein LSUE1_G000304 [Lachnellula suecica]|uniref:N-acetyltransferase domain-containing protein n=1 Tax=Lachnellula suecica TaxID=602035 RepID=A0A8T9CHN1_9HELO|nr:hypothetical protein LSUE1_G000304 [Lachnellula suecica]